MYFLKTGLFLVLIFSAAQARLAAVSLKDKLDSAAAAKEAKAEAQAKQAVLDERAKKLQRKTEAAYAAACKVSQEDLDNPASRLAEGKAAYARANAQDPSGGRLDWDLRAVLALAKAARLDDPSGEAEPLIHKILMEDARFAFDTSNRRLLSMGRARWALRALDYVDAAETVTKTPESLALRQDIYRRRSSVRRAIDFDLLELGAGTDRVYAEFLPYRILWIQGGWGLTIHTLSVQMIWPSNFAYYDDQKTSRTLFQPIELELEKCLFQSVTRRDIPLYSPYYGLGTNLSAYVRGCPWAFARTGLITSTVDDRTAQGPNDLQYWTSAQAYEVGLKLVNRFWDISGGYAWSMYPAVSNGPYSAPPLALDGWFGRICFRIY